MPSSSQDREGSSEEHPPARRRRPSRRGRRISPPFPWRYDPSHPIEVVPTPEQAKGMRMFWWDGFFAWGSEAIVVQYLPLYALAYGATAAQIGLLSAFVSLAAAVAFFPAARLAETWGRRKLIVVLAAGLGSRPMLLGLALLPFFLKGHQVVYVMMGFASMRSLMIAVAIPAWTSLTADLVPSAIRGRFLSWRNVGMGVAALMAAPLAGGIIGFAGFPRGWEIAWFLAFLLGQASTLAYARIPEPQPAPAVAAKSEREGRQLLADSNFLFFCGTTLLWNLSLYTAAPFFNVYLVQNLGASALSVGALAACISLMELVGMWYFGPLVDRRGSKWVMSIAGLGIPLLPWAWVLVQAPWQVAFINLAGGFMWAGFNLASLNLLLVTSPEQKRPTYAAAYQSAVYLSAFLGPLIGGFLVQAYGFRLIFGLSGTARLLSILLFIRLVREVKPASSLPPAPAEQG
jgi:MFS family permease